MKIFLALLITSLTALFSNAFAADAPGTLYGTAYTGGVNNFGGLFSYSPSSDTYDKLFDFSGPDGANPTTTLVQGQGATIYGMTYFGGNNGDGVIFSFNTQTSAYVKLHDFNDPDGASPIGGMVFGPDGKLYGVTAGGGSDGNGVLFSYDTTSGSFTKLYDFLFDIGGRPIGDLVLAPDGKLYGYAGYGSVYNGLMFSFNVATSAFTVVHYFSLDIEVNGDFPSGTPVVGADGKLYGVTSDGGAEGVGVLFSYDPLSTVYTKVFDFDQNNGNRPLASLVRGAGAELYGTTYAGAANDFGGIFSYNVFTGTFNKLFDFPGQPADEYFGGFTFASDGKLYGMTASGSEDIGAIYSFDVSNGTYVTLHDFPPGSGVGGIYPGLLLELRPCNPVITCPVVSPLCYNSTGKYSIPELGLTNECGSSTITFAISGATTRKGSGTNASGSFNIGTSIIKWTLSGANGKLNYCETTVTIKRSFSLSIPDVWAVKPGGLANTMYTGYGPPSLTLAPQITGGTAPYTYKWSTGAATPNITVSPISAGTFTYALTVTDATGCKVTVRKQVTMVDVRCGPKKDKVFLCRTGKWNYQNNKTICVSRKAVALHFKMGYYLCDSKPDLVKVYACDCDEEVGSLRVKAAPNPSATYFTLRVSGSERPLSIRVTDVLGRVIDTKNNVTSNSAITIGHRYRPGIYYAEIIQGSERVVIKLVKQ